MRQLWGSVAAHRAMKATQAQRHGGMYTDLMRVGRTVATQFHEYRSEYTQPCLSANSEGVVATRQAKMELDWVRRKR